jgi:hypothetical protein
LKEAGIVTVERSGKQCLYSLAGPQTFAALTELIAAVQSCSAAAGTPAPSPNAAVRTPDFDDCGAHRARQPLAGMALGGDR